MSRYLLILLASAEDPFNLLLFGFQSLIGARLFKLILTRF